ncbi:PadR family transcriptional regulator [Pseudoteredinibacter isoporae]|uniref:PadR family transcriptional regulator AphA n=1 Tax=Pseudoteredinibacter isoporae TaxID=570281 RepID=A0A7X0JTZ3_9GAMM|nr:PadR family transcriptional regulator [Pseudoteredinibacter isoporae]MBB6522230.1 PadR family transcriptional regulator AphA [Pseudoteredinibacter isoporae]NHO87764.1 PadR family transcriptional regulator [Pseudoteredinibacter isoporae]NIB23905.1 PadR family transcriptional regulator [Pseudoteredinibacter isoporae]
MSLKHAILTLLETEESSGYDLLKQFQSRLGYFWNASHQQIYAQLKSMHSEQLIDFHVEAQANKPDKKVYTLTQAGRDALSEWVQQPLKLGKVNDALLVKLYAGHLADKDQLLEEMTNYRDNHQRMLNTFLAIEEEYKNSSAKEKKNLALPYLTLRRGIIGEQACLDWADEVIDFLHS